MAPSSQEGQSSSRPTESLPGVITKIPWDAVVDCDIMQPDNTGSIERAELRYKQLNAWYNALFSCVRCYDSNQNDPEMGTKVQPYGMLTRLMQEL